LAYLIYKSFKGGIEAITEPITSTVDVITKPGINFIPALENVDVPKLIPPPGYKLIGDALPKVDLPKIDPLFPVLGIVTGAATLLSPKKTTTAQAHIPTPPIIYGGGTRAGLITNPKPIFEQIQAYNMAPRISGGRKVM